MTTKASFNKHSCPNCGTVNNVVIGGNGTQWGNMGAGGKPTNNVISEGGYEQFYYCKKCNIDFDVRVTYKHFDKVPEERKHL